MIVVPAVCPLFDPSQRLLKLCRLPLGLSRTGLRSVVERHRLGELLVRLVK
jgi:hypothetical protein